MKVEWMGNTKFPAITIENNPNLKSIAEIVHLQNIVLGRGNLSVEIHDNPKLCIETEYMETKFVKRYANHIEECGPAVTLILGGKGKSGKRKPSSSSFDDSSSSNDSALTAVPPEESRHTTASLIMGLYGEFGPDRFTDQSLAQHISLMQNSRRSGSVVMVDTRDERIIRIRLSV
ncbi:hypothetical protein Y032_0016g2966 [Ancylostoma ceylanicum]|nr:hypothetical protein Y032_0016g2966 [Ancylostoma ceylanicum]